MRRNILLLLTLCALGAQAKISETPQQVEEIINKVNTHWQATHPEHGRAFWDNAAYHTGNMEAYRLTGKPEYLDYSRAWSEHNDWKGAKSPDKSEWKYKTYGEGDDYVMFGDWQICFQTYADIYNLEPDSSKIARAKEVMEYQISTPDNDYWWWADGLYMVMPVMTKMYNITKDSKYLDKLNEYWHFADSLMYDPEAHLYYRDGKYIYPKHKSANGKKDFWARGDGWVVAALAKVIADLPATRPEREEYINRFRDMAAAVAACQQPEGYWTRSLLDPEHAPGPETSGTAFFTYGLLWGINNHILDRETYLPVVEKAWKYLTETAMQPDGSIGYVQPIGEKAIPGQVVDRNSTANFGTGAFLLAACEMYRLLTGGELVNGNVWLDTDGNPINAHGGGIMYHDGKYYWYGEYKKGVTMLPKWATWECYRTDVTGVGCYSSDDLKNWKFEGIVLPAVKDDPNHDLHTSKVLERPKVVYNAKTGKFVMWAHVESPDYSKACAGVAVSDSPTGPFTYLGSFRPNDAMSRDQTVFVDDDGTAYQLYSSENNQTLYISKLTDDYLKPSGEFTRNFVGASREAPAIFKHGGKYYLLSSGCTGWDPNQAELAVADSVLGPWTVLGNPCTGPDADKTFYGQSTYVVPVQGKPGEFIAMFDRWNKTDLEDSRYIWLPVDMTDVNFPKMPWVESLR